MERGLYKAQLLMQLDTSYRGIRIVSYVNQMCEALGVECVCSTSEDFVKLSELDAKVEHAVLAGFLPLFVTDSTQKMTVKPNMKDSEVYAARSYYNFAFSYVPKGGKRKRSRHEIRMVENLIVVKPKYFCFRYTKMTSEGELEFYHPSKNKRVIVGCGDDCFAEYEYVAKPKELTLSFEFGTSGMYVGKKAQFNRAKSGCEEDCFQSITKIKSAIDDVVQHAKQTVKQEKKEIKQQVEQHLAEAESLGETVEKIATVVKDQETKVDVAKADLKKIESEIASIPMDKPTELLKKIADAEVATTKLRSAEKKLTTVKVDQKKMESTVTNELKKAADIAMGSETFKLTKDLEKKEFQCTGFQKMFADGEMVTKAVKCNLVNDVCPVAFDAAVCKYVEIDINKTMDTM